MNISFENARLMDVEFDQGDAFNIGFANGDANDDVNFNPNAVSFDVSFSSGQRFNVDFGVTAQILPYEGSYEVTPKVTEQKLATNSKYMKDDVTVYGVPYYQTSNEYGYTVYIASEV